MRLLHVALAATLLVASRASGEDAAPTTVPSGQGLPVNVRAAVSFLEIQSVNDAASTFEATIDVRLLWQDARLAYPASETRNGVKTFRDEEAEAKIGQIWSPKVVLANVATPGQQTRGLRIFPDGRVELLQRTQATFKFEVDVERFPFDRQRLVVDLLCQREPMTLVELDFRQSDLEFSKVGPTAKADGWELGGIDLARVPHFGWNGERHARVQASLTIAREFGASVMAIFIPLFASLLIPLLALWLNTVEEDGEFKIEAFELTNILIGGLFAVIALNFTVNSSYPMLAKDNPVATLFALNYLLLGVSIAFNVLVFRFGFAKRWFGRFFQIEFYHYAVWALPTSVFAATALVLLYALA